MASMKPVNGIMGPVGSGKTSAMMIKTVQLAGMQPRSKIDGVRYSKALFVRETFRQLYGTTIPSWWQWFPKERGEWRGGGNEPAQHHLQFQLQEDGSIVDLVVLFEALGEQNVETLFRGKEFNLLCLNEADTLVPDVLSQGLVRINQGRYPGERHVDPADCVKQANLDYNAPDVENYLYHTMEENKPDDYGFFRQPGGLDPNAENRQRATLEDYQAMKRDLEAQGRDDLARRMVDNNYGFTREGKPVYPQYRDDFHCAQCELQPVDGLPIKVDADQGLHPGALLRQVLPNGQYLILDEMYCDTGAEGLAEQVKEVMGSRYPDHRLIGGLADPAGKARSGNDADTETWIDAFNRHLNLSGRAQVRAADTNMPDKCIAATVRRFRHLIDNAKPAVLISTRCRVLRKGLNSEYHYKRKAGDRNVYADYPVKKFPVSDLCNALEFACLDEGGYQEVVGREARKKGLNNGKPIQASVEVSI
jgi:hypothetical protein